jgi:type II secretory ATPase GspE/PulE/Tfp pilus assembly ATPase PilB-like protein
MKMVALLEPSNERSLQEGFFGLAADEQHPSSRVRVRIRTQPGPHGESASLRLLKDSEPPFSFDEIGLTDSVRTHFSALIEEAKGVVLIVGPAGSGKRTTLRCALDLLRASDRRVFTAEEMLLCKYDHAEQHVVSAGAGNGYPDLLRGFLSQSPDVIALERLLDGDAATQIFTAEGNGPLILATLQAGNTTSAIRKLLTFGVTPAALAASLSGVLTQRLVRRVCPHCEQAYEPRRSVLDEWFRCEPPFSRWRRGAGCAHCGGTGFSGRVVISELWIPTSEERVRIAHAIDTTSLREAALQRDRCIGQDALGQAIEGRTTLEEALKIVPYEDVVYTRLHGLEKDKTEEDDLRKAV